MIALETDPGLDVKVDAFEGSLELLLHLIKENKIDIYDIPIALITRQYLETLDQMRSFNLSIAGDFLVMAATLIHIKSKMLLPVQETCDEEDVEEDPRQELVTRLLEYKKFKAVAGNLASFEAVWRDVFSREPLPLSADPVYEEITFGNLEISDLLNALQKVIARLPDRTILTIEDDELSVRDKIGLITALLETQRTMLFEQLFDGLGTRQQVVVTFLALLEVIRLGLIKVLQLEEGGSLRLIGTDNLFNENAKPLQEEG
jgi:segregation and condensation protein A